MLHRDTFSRFLDLGNHLMWLYKIYLASAISCYAKLGVSRAITKLLSRDMYVFWAEYALSEPY